MGIAATGAPSAARRARFGLYEATAIAAAGVALQEAHLVLAKHPKTPAVIVSNPHAPQRASAIGGQVQHAACPLSARRRHGCRLPALLQDSLSFHAPL